MTTVFRALGLAITGLASGAASLDGGPCEYEEPWPTQTDIKRAIRVTKAGRSVCTVSDVAHGPRDWTTVYTIEFHARGATPSEADAGADELMGDVFEILADEGIGASLNLGVLALVVEPSVDFSDVETGDTSTAMCSLNLTVIHRTRGHTINEAWP